MGLHSKKDFAEMCGLSTNNLATYIGRKKVQVGEGDLIDDKDPVNKAFYLKRKGRVTEKKLLAHITNNAPSGYNDDERVAIDISSDATDEEGIPPLHVSEAKLKHLDTLKREKEVDLLSLRKAKLKGELVPSELVKPLFLQHNQSVMVAFKNAADDIARRIGRQNSIAEAEIIKLKGEFVGIINQAIENATKATVMSVESLIREYSQQRAVGERG